MLLIRRGGKRSFCLNDVINIIELLILMIFNVNAMKKYELNKNYKISQMT